MQFIYLNKKKKNRFNFNPCIKIFDYRFYIEIFPNNLIPNCNCKSMIIPISNNDNPTKLETTTISLVRNKFIIESHTDNPPAK